MVLCCQSEASPGSKENGRGGNDGSDIAIMPYISSKAVLPFLRPCLRIDSVFSAVFTLFSSLFVHSLPELGSVAQVAFQLILIVLLPCFRFDSHPLPSVVTGMSGIYSFPSHENILLAPAETFAYLLNVADP